MPLCRLRGVDHKIADEIIWPALLQGLTEELDTANERIAELQKASDEQNGKCPVNEQKGACSGFSYSTNMTTADKHKTVLEIKAELEDTKEALTLAVDALNEALSIGAPAIRDRCSQISWSHLRVTAQALMTERDSKNSLATHANDNHWGTE